MINTTLLSFSMIGLISTTLLLGFVLGVIIISYRRILSEVNDLREQKIKSQQAITDETQKVIQEAREKAINIMDQAKIVPEDEKRKIMDDLSVITQSQEHLYQQAVSDIKQKSEEEMTKMSSDIQKNVLIEIKNLLENFKTELKLSNEELQKSFSQKYQSELEQANRQIEDYKKYVNSNIDRKAKDILKDFSIQVLGKVISPEDHEDLIIKALEEAKKKNVF